MRNSRLRGLAMELGRFARTFAKPLILAVVFLVSLVAGFPGLGAMGTAYTDHDFVRLLISIGFLDAAGGLKARGPYAKVANYAIVSAATAAGDASGSVFTNRGAVGAVTFTLPAASLAQAGVVYHFYGVANQTFTVAGTAAQVVTFNNAAATSVACSTAGAKIGAHISATCDGTSWIVNGDTVGVTYTVA